MTSDAQALAEGLSKATRIALIDQDREWSLGTMLELGLTGCVYGDCRPDQLTPLGLAVRAILTRSNEHG